MKIIVLILAFTSSFAFFCEDFHNHNNYIVPSHAIQYLVSPEEGNIPNSDSVELLTLGQKLFWWRAKDKLEDFPIIIQDNLYKGINWELHNKKLHALISTGFFSKSFLEAYDKLALEIDKYIKISKDKSALNGIPDFDLEADVWCSCQFNLTYSKPIKISNLRVAADSASFRITFDYDFQISAKAIKENKIWKISSLEGFEIYKRKMDDVSKYNGR